MAAPHTPADKFNFYPKYIIFYSFSLSSNIILSSIQHVMTEQTSL